MSLEERRSELLDRARVLIDRVGSQAAEMGRARFIEDIAKTPTARELTLVFREIQGLDSVRSEGASPPPKAPKIRNRGQIIVHASAIIIALEEVLDYDPVRHHNNPPALRIENPRYLAHIRELVEELRRLNALLEAKRPRSAETKAAALSVAASMQRFLDNYIPVLAKGSAALTVAAMAGLLVQLGLGGDVVSQILAPLRLLR
jgi:hypothetical protein